MSYFEAIVLGIVQGLTEFLPISSSGHLRIVPELFGWSDPGASFTAVIQLGTMAAVVIFFWKDLWRITAAWCADAWGIVKARSIREGGSSDDARMGWYLIVATIPIAIFMGLYLRFLRPGRVSEVSLIGVVLLPALVQGLTSGDFVMGSVGDAGCTASDLTGRGCTATVSE